MESNYTPSPLYTSALELFGHSISHYVSGKVFDRKMVILHLANAVELILKDLLLMNKVSIYERPKETIGIHKAIKALKGKEIEIPVEEHIELLIEERNTLQHRFGSPEEITLFYYMEIGVEFFSKIFREYYSTDFISTLVSFTETKDFHTWREGMHTNEMSLDTIEKQAQIFPLGAYLSLWTYFKQLSSNFQNRIIKVEGYTPDFPDLYNGFYERFGLKLPLEIQKELLLHHDFYINSASGISTPTTEKVIECVNVIRRYEDYIQSINIGNVNLEVANYNNESYREPQKSKSGTVGYEHISFLCDTKKNSLNDKLELLYEEGGSLYSK